MAVNLVVYIFNNFVLKDLRKTFLKEPQKKKKKKKKKKRLKNKQIFGENQLSLKAKDLHLHVCVLHVCKL